MSKGQLGQRLPRLKPRRQRQASATAITPGHDRDIVARARGQQAACDFANGRADQHIMPLMFVRLHPRHADKGGGGHDEC